MKTVFVVIKTDLDFEGYPQRSEVVAIRETKESADKFIKTLPNPTTCHCGEHSDFAYDIQEKPLE